MHGASGGYQRAIVALPARTGRKLPCVYGLHHAPAKILAHLDLRRRQPHAGPLARSSNLHQFHVVSLVGKAGQVIVNSRGRLVGKVGADRRFHVDACDRPESVSTNPPCSKGIVSKPTGAQSVVPWASGGRAHRHRAVPGVWRLRAGGFGASGDRWWTQDRVFFGNNGPRGRPQGKGEEPRVCGHALSTTTLPCWNHS